MAHQPSLESTLSSHQQTGSNGDFTLQQSSSSFTQEEDLEDDLLDFEGILEDYTTRVVHTISNRTLKKVWNFVANHTSLLFSNVETEHQFRRQLFTDTRVSMAVCAIMGFLYVIMAGGHFDRPIFRETPDNYYSTEALWWGHWIGWMFFAGGMLLWSTGLVLAINTKKRILPLWALEVAAGIIYVAQCIPVTASRQTSFHVFFKPLGMLRSDRDDADFVKPYYFTVTALVFITAPRAIFTVPLILCLMLPSYFVSRALSIYPFTKSDSLIPIFSVFLCGLVIYLERISRQQFELVTSVKAQAESSAAAHKAVLDLMRVLVPETVLKRLIKREYIVDSGGVSVLFADVAGFTAWCSNRRADTVVEALNTFYRMIDTAKQEEFPLVVKVKTIGDAYWAMCGLPDHCDTHALTITRFALWVRNLVKQHQLFHVRYGIHSGMVVCGVVGVQNVSYEPFGATNELAEFIESSCEADTVMISSETHRQLKSSANEKDYVVDSLDGPVLDFHGEKISTYTVQNIMTSTDFLRQDTLGFGEEEEDDTYGEDLDSLRMTPSMRSDRSKETVRTTVSTARSDKDNHLRKGMMMLLGDEAMSFTDGNPVMEDVMEAQGQGPTDMQKRVRETFARKHKRVFLTYADLGMEERFREYCSSNFRKTSFGGNTLIFVMFFTVYLLSLFENRPQPMASHVLRSLALAIPLMFMVFPKIHVALNFGSLYAGYVLTLIGTYLMEDSLASNEFVYIMVFYSTAGLCRGVPMLSWIIVVACNAVVIVVLTMVITELTINIRVHHLYHPVTLLASWLVAQRRLEISARLHFQAQTLAQDAADDAAEQMKLLTIVLERVTPHFIIPTLKDWFQNGNQGYPSRSYDDLGVLFLRIPPLQDAEVLRRAAWTMQLIGAAVSKIDEAMQRFPEIVKVKTVGDIALIISGVISKPSKRNRRTGVDFNIEVPSGVKRYPHYSLGQLAISLCDAVEKAGEGMDPSRYGTVVLSASIGIHSGPVTCGIIGTERPIFDAFGDTVNVAARIAASAQRLQQDGGRDGSGFTDPATPVSRRGSEYNRSLLASASVVSGPAASGTSAGSSIPASDASDLGGEAADAGTRLPIWCSRQFVEKYKKDVHRKHKAEKKDPNRNKSISILNPTSSTTGAGGAAARNPFANNSFHDVVDIVDTEVLEVTAEPIGSPNEMRQRRSGASGDVITIAFDDNGVPRQIDEAAQHELEERALADHHDAAAASASSDSSSNEEEEDVQDAGHDSPPMNNGEEKSVDSNNNQHHEMMTGGVSSLNIDTSSMSSRNNNNNSIVPPRPPVLPPPRIAIRFGREVQIAAKGKVGGVVVRQMLM